MKRKVFCILAVFLLVSLNLTAEGSSEKKFPTQPINVSVGGSAGGSADLTARIIAALMEKELGQRIIVADLPGGSGGTASNEVLSKPHDGHYWLANANPQMSASVLGATDKTMKDWEIFLVAGTTGILSVREDSPYNTVEELFAAMKKAPGRIKWSAGPPGTPWQVQASLLAKWAGVEFNFVPYQGSNPSIIGCLNGEADAVLTGLSEQAEFLGAGKLKPLAVTEPQAMEVPRYGKVRTILEVVPEFENISPQVRQFNFFAVPADVNKETVAAIDAAFKKAMASQEMKNYCSKNYMFEIGKSLEEAKKEVLEQEKVFTWILHDLGIATKSPADFGIARPQ
jgi:tripartite-type tricarboxylate transporter receptor subunit TctC